MAVEFINPKNQYQAGENIGHSIALKDANIKALMDNYQNSNVLESSAIVEEVNQGLNSPMEETSVQIEPEVVSEIISNPLDNAIEAATTIEDTNIGNEQILTSEMGITPEISSVNIQPTIDQQPNILSEPSPIDVNSELTIQENPNIVPGQQPTINNQEVENFQPEVSQNDFQIQNPILFETTVENSNIDINTIRTSLNSVLDILDKKSLELDEKEKNLIARETEVAQKESEISAKLTIANQAFENAQNVIPIINEQQKEGQSLSLAA